MRVIAKFLAVLVLLWLGVDALFRAMEANADQTDDLIDDRRKQRE